MNYKGFVIKYISKEQRERSLKIKIFEVKSGIYRLANCLKTVVNYKLNQRCK
jgi:hypothetical protein